MPDEVLIVRELADPLKIGDKTAYPAARNGELPRVKFRDRQIDSAFDTLALTHDLTNRCA